MKDLLIFCCTCCPSASAPQEVNVSSLCWLGWPIAMFFGLWLIDIVLPRKIKTCFWAWIHRYLWVGFLLVWMLGIVTYCVGTCFDNVCPFSFPDALTVVPMAIIRSTLMFLGQSDISAIPEGLQKDLAFMLFFNLSHILAVLCTMLYVLHQFGFFVIGKFKTWFLSLIEYKLPRCLCKYKKKTLNVFWGLNDSSFILAKEIDYKHKDEKIVFVRTFDDEDSHSSKMGFQRIFDQIKLKNSEIAQLRSIKCRVTTAFRRLSSVKPDQKEGKEIPTDILWGKLNLKSLVRMINSTKNVRIFLLNDDEALNLKCTRVIVNDSFLCKALEKGDLNVKIYCHARRNSISLVEENMHTAERMEVNIVDTSRLSIEWIKSVNDGIYQPVRYMTLNTQKMPGAVTSDFHSLLIGFGETGRDAFRFLYEYTALLDADSTANPRPRKMVCDVVDAKMNDILPAFKNSTPNVKWNELPGIHFHPTNYYTQDFYDKVLTKEKLRNLNYVIIALGNDDYGMTLANTILEQSVKVRENLNQFHIFLRVYDRQRAREIKHIVQHYNNIYRVCCGKEIIVPFGDPVELFTYDFIIADKLKEEAKVFLEEYNKQYKEQHRNETVLSWDERRKKLLGDGKNYLSISELRRKESQDIANAQHKYTKDYIYREVARHIGKNTKLMEELQKNLAITEHLRWNAAHEMLGYQYDQDIPKCDERTMRHNCLTDWKKLTSSYQEYDEIVVTATLPIFNQKNENKES